MGSIWQKRMGHSSQSLPITRIGAQARPELRQFPSHRGSVSAGHRPGRGLLMGEFMAGEGARSAPKALAWLLPLLALLIALGAYADYRHQVPVSFTVHSSAPARMQVFHDAKGRFAESRSRWLDVGDGAARRVDFKVRGTGAMLLRFDPPAGAVTMVCDIRIGGGDAPARFELLRASQLAAAAGEGCLRLESEAGAGDPQVAVRFSDDSERVLRRAVKWQWVLIVSLLAMIPVIWRIGSQVRHLQGVRSMPVLPGFGRFQQWAHWACAALMLVFGLAYLAVTPPGAVPDEAAHLRSIINISQNLPPANSEASGVPHLQAIYGEFWDYPTNKGAFTGRQLREQLGRPLMCHGPGAAEGSAGYFPHHYLLPAVTYKAGCAAGGSFGWFLYVARFLNLLLATVLVAGGVACASRGKLGLFVVALLPMSLFQMSSLSADSLMISLGIAWLGVVSGVASGSLQLRRAAPALWALSLAIALLKPGAAWILACILFCKPAYDAAGQSFAAAVAKFLVLPFAIHLGLSLSITEGARAIAGVDSVANMHSILSDPLGFLRTVVLTFHERGERLWDTMVGVLGWLDVSLTPESYAAALLIVLAAAFANPDSELRRPRYVVPLALLAIAGSMVLMALPMFIYWTPLGSPTIHGLQGRYFTLTAAFALVWLGLRSPHPVQALLGGFILAGLVLINTEAVYQLYDAYFVSGRS